MWTFVDSAALVAWIAFVWNGSTNALMPTNREWYEEQRSKITCAPPGWLFGVAWGILYALIIAASFIFTRDFEASIYYLATFIVLLVNILLNQAWSRVFFSSIVAENQAGSSVGIALVIALLMFVTEIAVLILFGLTEAWVSFGLYVPYAIWTLFAIYLNIQWYRLGLADRPETPRRTKLENTNQQNVGQRQRRRRRIQIDISSRRK